MSVTDFECAIAKSQIARYIAGENLSPEVSRQLETHISACPRCKQLLQEKKSSLEAIIVDRSSSPIHVPVEPVPMTSGNLALNREVQQLMATSADEVDNRFSLREKLAQAKKDRDNSIDLPAVAPAFAHKDTPQATGVKVQVESALATPKKKGFSLSSLALFTKVPDQPATEQVQPAMTVENLRSAKEVLKTKNASMKKPVMYLCGLCAVVAAMSFFLKDPTALFGGKAAQQNLLVKDKAPKTGTPTKKSTKVSKAPAKRLPTAEEGTSAQEFTPTEIPAKPVKKPTAVKPAITTTVPTEETTEAPVKPTPKLTKPVVKPTLKPVHKPTAKPATKPVVKKTAKPLAKTRKPAKRSSVTLHQPTAADSTVKIYPQ